jgi:hypothetical protein
MVSYLFFHLGYGSTVFAHIGHPRALSPGAIGSTECLRCLDNEQAPQFALVLEVVESIARMEAVHTGAALALDSDLIIAGASNSDALEVLVPGRMRAVITAEHHIRLLLLDHMKEYVICFVEFFVIFIKAFAHMDPVKGERVEAAYLLRATPSNCLAEFVNSVQSIAVLHCLVVIGEIALVLCRLQKGNHDTACRLRHGEPFCKLDLIIRNIFSIFLKAAAIILNCSSMVFRTNIGIWSCKSSTQKRFEPMVIWNP